MPGPDAPPRPHAAGGVPRPPTVTPRDRPRPRHRPPPRARLRVETRVRTPWTKTETSTHRHHHAERHVPWAQPPPTATGSLTGPDFPSAGPVRGKEAHRDHRPPARRNHHGGKGEHPEPTPAARRPPPRRPRPARPRRPRL